MSTSVAAIYAASVARYDGSHVRCTWRHIFLKVGSAAEEIDEFPVKFERPSGGNLAANVLYTAIIAGIFQLVYVIIGIRWISGATFCQSNVSPV